jgi:hypothetical protein
MQQTTLDAVNDMMLSAAKAHRNGEMSDERFLELLELASFFYEWNEGA